ncbi:MAG: uroporphyrinogen-III C-methyltransferase [Huintestinicola sp.]
MKKGYVYLCGAGCGEADLITVRGMNALKSCDTVIYDALIDEKLLEIVPENAERICVGKRAGKHSEKQENINDIIVENALSGKCVVRLKGGDPLVFGRGGEEADALEKNGIAYEFIPGITSAVAVPELAGIPVTHRNVSRSFHVITGHTADDTLPENMAEYARLNGTIVFLMGLRNLRKIAEGLIEYGKSPDTPAAVISTTIWKRSTSCSPV